MVLYEDIKSIDITNAHSMCTGRVGEQFGCPRWLRIFVVQHIDWMTAYFKLNEIIDPEKLSISIKKLVQQNELLRTMHRVENDRDILYFLDYDEDFDYLKYGTGMFRVYYVQNHVLVTASHVISDFKSCFKIGQDLKKIYTGGNIEPYNGITFYEKLNNIFIDKTKRIVTKEKKIRFLKFELIKLVDLTTKYELFAHEAKSNAH